MPTQYYVNALPAGANIAGNPPLGSDSNTGLSASVPWRTLIHAQGVVGANYANISIMYPDGVYRSVAPVWNNVLSYFPLRMANDFNGAVYDIYNAAVTGLDQVTCTWGSKGMIFPNDPQFGYLSFGGQPGGITDFTGIFALQISPYNSPPPQPLFSINGQFEGTSGICSAAIPNQAGKIEFNFGNSNAGQLLATVPLDYNPHIWAFNVQTNYQAIYLDGTVIASKVITNGALTGVTVPFFVGEANIGVPQALNGTMFAFFINFNSNVFPDASVQSLTTWLNAVELPRLPANQPNITGVTLPLPPMVVDLWRVFKESSTDALVRAQALAASTSVLPSGYNIVNNILQEWTGTRDGSNNPLEYTTNFPSGVAACANYCKTLGFGFGAYFGPMPPGQNCDIVPGAGFEYIDMQHILTWGTLKMVFQDGSCSAAYWPSVLAAQYAFRAMGVQCANNGIIYLCCVPPQSMWTTNMMTYLSAAGATIMLGSPDLGMMTFAIMCTQIDQMVAAGIPQMVAPGRFNCPDYLGVGGGTSYWLPQTGMNDLEGQSNMAMWCILACPLFTGCDFTQSLGSYTNSTYAATIATLTNPDAIGVDQDPLVLPATRVTHAFGQTEFMDVWTRPLSGGKHCIVLLNRDSVPQRMSVNWGIIGLGGVSHQVRDVWASATLQNAVSYSTVVPSHGSSMLVLTPTPVTGSGWAVVLSLSGAYYTMLLVSGQNYPELQSIITTVASQQAGIAYQIANGLY